LLHREKSLSPKEKSLSPKIDYGPGNKHCVFFGWAKAHAERGRWLGGERGFAMSIRDWFYGILFSLALWGLIILVFKEPKILLFIIAGIIVVGIAISAIRAHQPFSSE